MKSITLLCVLFLFSYHIGYSQCDLPKPASAVVTSWTSCSATLTWTAVEGAHHYKVKFKYKDAIGWTILPEQVTGLTYTFNNLTPDTTYKFAVASACENGFDSGFKNAQKKTSVATLPQSVTAFNPVGTAVTLSWNSPCDVIYYNVRRKVTGIKGWTTIEAATTTTTYVATDLAPNTSYDFQVKSVTERGASVWTSSLTVNSGTIPIGPSLKPNMIVYVLDDGRYDNYQPNGGPEWFNSASINRIANEGINFKYAFPTTSQCAPSRVSIYTGLYAHKHGAVDNRSRRFDNLTMVQEVLRSAGYYTGFVGKFGQFQGDPIGFDWWATSDGNIFSNPPYRINGKDTTITGHISDVYQDLALTFLNSVPEDQKFLLVFFTRVPHTPTLPRSEDLHLYSGEEIPFPDNFTEYEHNYPSYFYNGGHKWNYSINQTDSLKRVEYQCIYGSEVNVTTLFDWLTNRGILDSTMIIFSSDNGYLQGEHKLEAKQLAQEESIRVPMFIRYPAWFPAGTVSNIQAMNVDIAPTLLEAAGIPDTFGMDGTSLYQLYTNQVPRKYFYYQFAGEDATPPIRAVRTNEFKYVKHYCNEVTEEFYDLDSDPGENVNQINNSDYSSVISIYRDVLDSMRTALDDAAPEQINCFLSSPQFRRDIEEETEAFNLQHIEVYPNPASDYFVLNFNDEVRERISIVISNMVNEQIYFKEMPNSNSCNILINSTGWTSGIYLVTLNKGGKTFTQKFTIQ